MRLIAIGLVCLVACGSIPRMPEAMAAPQDQVQPAAPKATPVAKLVKPRDRKPPRPLRAPTAKAAEPEPPPPYSAALWAHENAAEERLKKSIAICHGC